ncbi:hypothetical protein BKD09_07435 [Bradyrhizobium japonicum]|uniref:DUF5681 domain-containing protein n=1 Tax=Bradyrhizobium japonicum TaxID=375 RepID=A0A1L3F4C3_BRAJP|nr:DUF5681 domain-containing protein [Bradyrhizobium japonicum]APG08156.1 hypothetical protein BKD09_07435 [Bradyrhizobium japonicum]
MSLANTRQKQAGGFKKGVSGNPHGRPAGSRNKATLAVETLLDGQAEALTQKAVEMALAGDVVALRLCLDRIYPVRKDRPVAFQLPPITSARDAADIMAAVAQAVAVGHITPADAAEYSKVVDVFVKAYHAAGLDDRVTRVEQLTDAELLRIASGGRTLTIPSGLLRNGD